MKKYEIMYIVNASLDDAAFKTVSDRLHATITENGGSIDKVDDWCERIRLRNRSHEKGTLCSYQCNCKQCRSFRIPTFVSYQQQCNSCYGC